MKIPRVPKRWTFQSYFFEWKKQKQKQTFASIQILLLNADSSPSTSFPSQVQLHYWETADLQRQTVRCIFFSAEQLWIYCLKRNYFLYMIANVNLRALFSWSHVVKGNTDNCSLRAECISEKTNSEILPLLTLVLFMTISYFLYSVFFGSFL